jgi:hypothetical protein
MDLAEFLAEAKVRTGGRLWSDKAGGAVDSFYLLVGTERIWLHVNYCFEGAGAFQVQIIDFGLEGKLIQSRMSFDLEEIGLIKAYLQSYFSPATEKRFAPFTAGKCTKVVFKADWIEREKTKPK